MVSLKTKSKSDSFPFTGLRQIRSLGLVMGLIAGGILVLLSRSASAQWQMENTVDYPMDRDGVFELSIDVGQIELGKSERLPLVVRFNALEQAESFLGPGFSFSIFDSHIVAPDATTFEMLAPDGHNYIFQRPNSQASQIKCANWQGEIRGDHIVINTPEGWVLDYKKGILQSIITPSNKLYTLRRTLQTRELLGGNNETLLRMENNPADNMVRISRPEGNIQISLGKRPQIEHISRDMMAIRDLVRGVERIQLPDGHEITLSYKVTPKMQPVLSCTGALSKQLDGEYTWNAVNGRNICHDNNAFELSRTNDSEKISITGSDGKSHTTIWRWGEVTEIEDGVKTTRHYFSSGILSGKLRKIEVERDGVTQTIFQARYNEKGMPLSETKLLNGKEQVAHYSYIYNKDGLLDQEIKKEGEREQVTRYVYGGKQDKEISFFENGEFFWKETYKNGALTERETKKAILHFMKDKVSFSEKP